MARIHARRRGKSGSKRPLIKKNPEWVPIGKDEVEKLIVKLARDGLTTARIGIVLRDNYAVPSVKLATGKSISQILRENGLTPEIPEDLATLMKKAINVDLHLAQNRKDFGAKRGLQLVESKIRRLIKYYKRIGALPENWTYSLKTAELQIE